MEGLIFEMCCGIIIGVLGALIILGLKAAGGMFAISGGEPGSYPPRGSWPRRGWIAVLDQYERAVKFRFGKFKKVNNVGLAFRWPIIDQFLAVDIRDRPENIPGQICITRDNVSIKVDGVVYWKVIDPAIAVLAVSEPASVIRQATMSALRVVIGEFTLDELLSKREIIAHRMEDVLDNFCRPLGIDISRIDITDVVIPSDMQRAMAREAEAQRERRARLRRAEGEVEAVKNLAHAANTLEKNPELLELRRLQTVGELGMEQHTLISLVLPYDYGNLGGGRPRGQSEFSDEENDAFLESIKVIEIEEVIEEVVEEPVNELPEPEPPAPPEPTEPILDVPPAPDFGDEEAA
jgi:hypothetical protein